MGFQVCPIPTALLSTHTGGFSDYTFLDLSEEMKKIGSHFKALDIHFDCIYTGFLGSEEQISIVSDFITSMKRENQLIVIDPVMADNGTLYETYTNEMAKKMAHLTKYAHILTPNITEAAILLGMPYPEEISEEEIKNWLTALSKEGPDYVVITSVPFIGHKNSVAAFDRKNNKFYKIYCNYIKADYPGTGDTFASVLLGAMLGGEELPFALQRAMDYIYESIKYSCLLNAVPREGILIEQTLDLLKKPLNKVKFCEF